WQALVRFTRGNAVDATDICFDPPLGSRRFSRVLAASAVGVSTGLAGIEGGAFRTGRIGRRAAREDRRGDRVHLSAPDAERRSQCRVANHARGGRVWSRLVDLRRRRTFGSRGGLRDGGRANERL